MAFKAVLFSIFLGFALFNYLHFPFRNFRTILGYNWFIASVSCSTRLLNFCWHVLCFVSTHLMFCFPLDTWSLSANWTTCILLAGVLHQDGHTWFSSSTIKRNFKLIFTSRLLKPGSNHHNKRDSHFPPITGVHKWRMEMLVCCRDAE